jgi:hypothetical protein
MDKEQERETERDSRQKEQDQNTKRTMVCTKKEHGAQNGRPEEVIMYQETSLPIQPDSLSSVQLTMHKVNQTSWIVQAAALYCRTH